MSHSNTARKSPPPPPPPANSSVGPIVALQPDGRQYNGDLVADIVDYRRLRAASLTGVCVTEGDAAAINRLERRLRAHGAYSERREFHRFECRHSARVVALEHNGTPIHKAEIADLGGGGAKVELECDLEPGERVELVIRVAAGRGNAVRVTFACRVAWVREGAAGIMFAGPPRIKRFAA